MSHHPNSGHQHQYGTSMFKGGERFPKTKPALTANVNLNPPPGIAEQAAKAGGSVWSKSSGPRIAPLGRAVSANAELYVPPPLGSTYRPVNAKGTAIMLATPRYRDPNSSSDSLNLSSEFSFVPKGMGDAAAKKRGSVVPFGSSETRFHDQRPRGSLDINSSDYGTIAAQAVKSSRSKSVWSRSSGDRMVVRKSLTGDTDYYQPPPMGAHPRGMSFSKYTPHGAFAGEGKPCNAPYHDPPTFVDLILRK